MPSKLREAKFDAALTGDTASGNISVAAIEPIEQNKLTAMKARVQFS